MKLLEPYTDGGRFDVVVIGSGFGGSVSACRFAEADQSVLVLERGRPYPPGSFPRSPEDMRAAFWDPNAAPLRHVQRLALPGHRGGGVERARRWFAHLRQRAAPQGRALVHPGHPGRQRPGAVGRQRGPTSIPTTTAPSGRSGPRPCRSG